MHSEDRNDRDQFEHMLGTDLGHRCLMILAIDFSQYLAPPPPPPLQKSPWEHLIISTFEVPSTHYGKKFDPEAQTVCIGYQR